MGCSGHLFGFGADGPSAPQARDHNVLSLMPDLPGKDCWTLAEPARVCDAGWPAAPAGPGGLGCSAFLAVLAAT
jgi:hypothetical protein